MVDNWTLLSRTQATTLLESGGDRAVWSRWRATHLPTLASLQGLSQCHRPGPGAMGLCVYLGGSMYVRVLGKSTWGLVV